MNTNCTTTLRVHGAPTSKGFNSANVFTVDVPNSTDTTTKPIQPIEVTPARPLLPIVVTPVPIVVTPA